MEMKGFSYKLVDMLHVSPEVYCHFVRIFVCMYVLLFFIPLDLVIFICNFGDLDKYQHFCCVLISHTSYVINLV